jgi:hypothetical protein
LFIGNDHIDQLERGIEKMSNQKRMKGILVIVVIALALGIAIQLVPVDRSNPPVNQELSWDSPRTRDFARRACFDCHSNETQWPWYSRIAPVSWLIVYDVENGRKELNFSEEGYNSDDAPAELASEIEETIRNGSMPPWNYVMANRKARRLSTSEKEDLIQGYKFSLLKNSSNETGTQKFEKGYRNHSENDDDDD